MNQDLIERYIYAVTKRLPGRSREDVAKELRTLILDMLEERCGQMIPSDKDIRVVLTELGTPTELYAQYSGEGQKCLIGPPYYAVYLYVMKIVMIATLFGVTLAFVLTCLIEGERMWVLAVFRWIGMLLSGGLGAFAFVTALFAFFHYREIPIEGSSGLDNLPPVPEKRDRISKWDGIFGIGICMVFVLVFLFCPQIFCIVTAQGEVIPIFDGTVIKNTWYLIIAFGIIGIVGEIVKLVDGRYTRRVMITTIVCNLLSAVCSSWWLLGNNLANPRCMEVLMEALQGSETAQTMFSDLSTILWGIILLLLVIDTVTVVVRTRRTAAKEDLI